MDEFPDLIDRVGRETVDWSTLDQITLDGLKCLTDRIDELLKLVIADHAGVLNMADLFKAVFEVFVILRIFVTFIFIVGCCHLV